jgi:exosortase/archaeosortase family protein
MVLEVAEGCSGLHHLVSLIALSIPVAYFTQKKMWKGITFVLFASLLSFFLNAFRIFLIGITTHFYPTDEVHGPFNVLIVHFTFIVAVVLLVIIGMKFRDTDPKTELLPQKVKSVDDKIHGKTMIAGLLPVILVIGLLSLAYCSTGLIRLKAVPSVVFFEDLKKTLKNYTVREEKIADELSSTENPDEKIQCTIISEDQKYTYRVYYEYYSLQSNEKELISFENRVLFKNGKNMKVVSNGKSVDICKRIEKDTTLFTWFFIDNKVYGNPSKAKIKVFFNSLFFGRNNGGIVIVKLIPAAGIDVEMDRTTNNLLSELVRVFVAAGL